MRHSAIYNLYSSVVRIHGDGMVAETVKDTATAPTASVAAAGYEVDGTLAVGMFAFRTNGDNVLIDLNIGGTIKSIDLGLAS